MRIRLFNVKYSPNLGDGLLSECMEAALIELGLDAKSTYSVDLAARVDYAQIKPGRGRALKLLESLPRSIRKFVVRTVLRVEAHRKWIPHYKEHLEFCDLIVIGGGNLFSDMDLNFPTKLSCLLKIARERRIPVAIYGVGVSSRWSDAGKRLMISALAGVDLRYLAVRDENSATNLKLLLGGIANKIDVVRDPGFLASRYFSIRTKTNVKVGLCITSALAVRYHSDVNVTDVYLSNWYCRLVKLLLGFGVKVKLFTNGSPEDIEFAKGVCRKLKHPSHDVFLTPEGPSELLSCIHECNVVAGYRMHALVAAVSYGIPPVGFAWDEKMAAFMGSIGMIDYLYDTTKVPPEIVVESIMSLREKRQIRSSEFVDDAFSSLKTLIESSAP